MSTITLVIQYNSLLFRNFCTTRKPTSNGLNRVPFLPGIFFGNPGFKFHVSSALNQGVTRYCQRTPKAWDAVVTSRGLSRLETLNLKLETGFILHPSPFILQKAAASLGAVLVFEMLHGFGGGIRLDHDQVTRPGRGQCQIDGFQVALDVLDALGAFSGWC